MSRKTIKAVGILLFVFLIGSALYMDVLLVLCGVQLLLDTGVFVFLCTLILTVLANVLIFWLLIEKYIGKDPL